MPNGCAVCLWLLCDLVFVDLFAVCAPVVPLHATLRHNRSYNAPLPSNSMNLRLSLQIWRPWATRNSTWHWSGSSRQRAACPLKQICCPKWASMGLWEAGCHLESTAEQKATAFLRGYRGSLTASSGRKRFLLSKSHESYLILAGS